MNAKLGEHWHLLMKARMECQLATTMVMLRDGVPRQLAHPLAEILCEQDAKVRGGRTKDDPPTWADARAVWRATLENCLAMLDVSEEPTEQAT